MTVQVSLSDLPVVATPMTRTGWIEDLAVLRQEWEAAAGGDSLLDVSASVGLMLLDIADRLGLTQNERLIFLGDRLACEAEAILSDSQA